jgi:SRSO17 transposase
MMTLARKHGSLEYTASLASVLRHAARVRPFADYCIGLLSAEGRKSIEPLAAVTGPAQSAAQHQSPRPRRPGPIRRCCAVCCGQICQRPIE